MDNNLKTSQFLYNSSFKVKCVQFREPVGARGLLFSKLAGVFEDAISLLLILQQLQQFSL